MTDERHAFPFLTAFVVTGVGLYAFYRVHEALTPFLLAAAFAYVLNPVVSYFEARGLRRSHLVVAGYALALALSLVAYAGLKSMILSETELFQSRAPGYLSQVQKLVYAQQVQLAKKLPLPPKITEHALESALSGALHALQELPAHFFALLPLLAHALLVPFIGFFFLLDAPDGVTAAIQILPSRYVEQAIHLLSEIDSALGNYLRGILIVAAAITLISFVSLVIMGIDNAIVIAVLSGASSFVPYLGAIVGALVGGGMAFYQFGTLSAAMKVVALFVGIRLADEIFLQPVIAKHSVHLHPMVFLLALVLGGEMFGFIGLVFAIPAACILKALVSVAWSWYSSERGLALNLADGAGVPYT